MTRQLRTAAAVNVRDYPADIRKPPVMLGADDVRHGERDGGPPHDDSKIWFTGPLRKPNLRFELLDTRGQSIPYNWWRLQKAVDMYTIRGRFTPLYSYERSVRWPNGHRNVLFSMRGRPVLDVTNEEEIGQANTGNALFPYLHKYNGVSSPHTSGSRMGTDFRDNDPAVEPLVEIYQGYRSNFETLGAPRAPTQQESTRIYGRFRLERMGKGTEAWGAGKLRSRFNAYLICGILCRPSRSRCHHLSYESAPFLCSNG